MKINQLSLITPFCLQIDLPKVPIPLAAKDASTEFDEFDTSIEYFDDDPKYVAMFFLHC